MPAFGPLLGMPDASNEGSIELLHLKASGTKEPAGEWSFICARWYVERAGNIGSGLLGKRGGPLCYVLAAGCIEFGSLL